MSDQTKKTIDSIKNVLMDKPLSISDIAKKAKINWRTAEHYLETLKNLGIVDEKEIKNTRTFFYIDRNNYFDLPIKKDDIKLISSIYSQIKESCLKLFKKEPTRTHIYKIIWNVNKKLKLNLPVGWYRYGPCCVQIYQGDEKEEKKLNRNEIKIINKTTEEYCILDKIALQKKIYADAENNLYLTKEDLLEFNSDNKENLNMILMNLIKYVPQETIETTTDFARATLLLGWDKTKTIFGVFWKYITIIVFKQTLKPYYGSDLDIYLDRKIDIAKKEAQIYITDLVRSNVKSK